MDTASTIRGTHINADGDFTTFFALPGIYKLEIVGNSPHLRGYPSDKLIDVLQWGDIVWRDMEDMFQDWPGTGFSATDAPNMSLVTSMKEMFLNASNFDGDVTTWDVSNIRNMDGIFREALAFNQPIGNWNVRLVENLNAIFFGSDSFNQDISGWDVSSVRNMNSVFFGAESFDQPLGTWDVSSANTMVNTFRDAKSFNQNISNWDVSQVQAMEQMFQGAESFNQPIGTWDVSKVTRFKRMFLGAIQFDQSLGNWKFNTNATFQQFGNSGGSMSCQNYSSTILGWNFNNPDLEDLPLSGFSSDYDATASRAVDELQDRGWPMSDGTDIGGDCGSAYQFPCSDTLSIGPDTLFGILTLNADQSIILDSIVFDTTGSTLCTSGESINCLEGFEVIRGSEFTANIGAFICNPSPPDTIFIPN